MENIYLEKFPLDSITIIIQLKINVFRLCASTFYDGVRFDCDYPDEKS